MATITSRPGFGQKRTSKVVLNRAKVDELRLGIADSLFAVAVRILDNTEVPDAAPFGEGLVQGGAALVWVDKQKVDGTTVGGRQVKKPRALRLAKGTDGIQAIVGFGFPGRFVHNGTEHSRPNPFLQRSVLEILPDAKGIAGNRLKRWLKGMR